MRLLTPYIVCNFFKVNFFDQLLIFSLLAGRVDSETEVGARVINLAYKYIALEEEASKAAKVTDLE